MPDLPPLTDSPTPSGHGDSSVSAPSSAEISSRPMELQRNGSTSQSRANPTVPTPKPPRLKSPQKLYPMEYGRHMRDMEQWDNLYFRRGWGRHTIVPSEDIPHGAVILDIGCGYGTWAIMMAHENKDYRIYGFDAAVIQPNLWQVGLRELAERITWVHGNMLEPLPFQDCHFDLVRANYVEFCVPENKWDNLFQEIERVLKPGGVFETSQGGMVLPCPRFAPRPHSTRQQMKTSTGNTRSQATDELANTDPRDHSKLKAAFDAMLEARFLNPKITTIIPFHMNLHFINVMMTPTFRIMLPPSTFIRSPDDIPDGYAAEPRADTEHDWKQLVLKMEKNATNSEVVMTQGGHMHLTHTMNAVLACKEAIWEQFDVLNPELTRLDFDCLLRNWELDMRDRIDMRRTLEAGLGWRIPTDSDREDCYNQTWRDNMTELHANEGLWDAQPLPEACRTLRAFTGFKPGK